MPQGDISHPDFIFYFSPLDLSDSIKKDNPNPQNKSLFGIFKKEILNSNLVIHVTKGWSWFIDGKAQLNNSNIYISYLPPLIHCYFEYININIIIIKCK